MGPAQLMPAHCALKLLADVKSGVWLGTLSVKNKEGDMSKLMDSRMPNYATADGGLALAAKASASRAATATAKTMDAEKADGCDWDKDGRPDCAVTEQD